MSAQIPDDDLLADLRRVADELGRPPTISEYDANGAYSSRTLHNRFGAWEDALITAGLDIDAYDPSPGPDPIPDDELLDELRSVAEELGHPPTSNEFAAKGNRASALYFKQFGSWEGALDAAGLDVAAYRDVVRKSGGVASPAGYRTSATDAGERP